MKDFSAPALCALLMLGASFALMSGEILLDRGASSPELLERFHDRSGHVAPVASR